MDSSNLCPARLVSLFRQLFSYPPLRTTATDYDAYWEDKRGKAMGNANTFQTLRARWIASRVQDGDSVLDIGSGDGAVLLKLASLRQLDLIAVDVSQKALDFLATQGIRTMRADITNTAATADLPDADHILLLEVLEHLPDPERFLADIEHKARKSVVFSFPNTGYVMHRLRFLLGRFPLQWRTHPGEHLRFWTLADLQWWLRSMGLTDRAVIHVYEGIPLLNRIWKGLFGAAFIVQINARTNVKRQAPSQ